MCLAALAAPTVAMAAPPPISPVQQGETLQRQQQQQIDQDQEQILTSPRAPTVIELPTHAQKVAPKGACQTITAITFLHAPRMSAKTRARLTAPYLNRCLGLGDVENLLSDITRFYVGQSEPTTRAYIQPQHLQKGELVLEIVEGRVEKVILDNHGWHGVNLAAALGRVDNTAFNLRVFEQGLDQINRLGSNHATLDILPGDNPGDSIVRIRNTADFPAHLTLSYDNTGQPGTGRSQAAATVVFDDLLHLNDQISYTRRQSIPDGRPHASSDSDSVLVSVPYAALTFTAGYNDSVYTSQTTTSGGTTYVLTGDTRYIFGEVDDAVWRDSRGKLDLSATITSKLNKNYIDGTYLSVSSRTLTVLDLKADYTTVIGRGSLKLGAGWSTGLDAFGALKDASGLSSSAPRAQFNKPFVSAYLSLPFTLAGRPVTFTSQVEGQYALTPLYSSEQLVIGSPYTVRGFLKGSLINDRGVYAQNDVSTTMSFRLFQRAVAVRPHVGVDGGYVASAAPHGGDGFLSGASAGVGVQSGRFSVDAYTSHELARATLRDEGFLTFVRAAVAF